MRSFWAIQQVCASKPENLHPISELKYPGKSSELAVVSGCGPDGCGRCRVSLPINFRGKHNIY